MKRSRLYEWGLAVILLSIAFCPRAAHPQERLAPTASIDTVLIAYLEHVAGTALQEDAACLLGDWHRGLTQDTLVIHAAALTPWLILGRTVTPTGATIAWRWDRCPPLTVALWHSHPARLAARGPFDEASCHFSPPDRALLALPQAPILSLVSVRPGLTCVFLRTTAGEVVQLPFDRAPP